MRAGAENAVGRSRGYHLVAYYHHPWGDVTASPVIQREWERHKGSLGREEGQKLGGKKGIQCAGRNRAEEDRQKAESVGRERERSGDGGEGKLEERGGKGRKERRMSTNGRWGEEGERECEGGFSLFFLGDREGRQDKAD